MTTPDIAEHQALAAPSINDYVLDGTKVMYYGDRIRAWERGERIAPITMDVAWTRACQASCSFCYASTQASSYFMGDPSKPKKITKKVAFEYLEDAAEIGVKGVSLISDGESTVVPWYAESIQYAAKVGIKIGVGSNGIALTRDVLAKIMPHVSYIRFNFSAGERKRYAEIMGLEEKYYDIVLQNIADAMDIKRRDNLPVNINMQLVCDPKDSDQLMPFAHLVRKMRPSYGIVKHTADTPEQILAVDYSKYAALHDTFRAIEAMGDDECRMVVKWNRIVNEGKREYSKCMGPPFIMQISGNGLVGPCGLLFNEKFKAFHIGSILDDRFRNIWASDRYWEVMEYLNSDQFNPQERCGSNCLQDRTNDWLFRYKAGTVALPHEGAKAPPDLEFI